MFEKSFLSNSEKAKIKSAVQKAELKTSGEIRVHISKNCSDSALDCATFWFEKLEMHKTEQRNGVLFFLSTKDKKFAIIGDVGINSKVSIDFWDQIKDTILENFKEQRFEEGLSKGILMAGEQLKKYFPYQKDDVNELSDDISFG